MSRLILFALSVAVVQPLDHDLQYIATLRKNRFFRLSELHANQLLTASSLEPTSRSQVVVELSKTFVAQALNSRPPQRAKYWEKAALVLEEAARTQDKINSKLPLQAQKAFVLEQQSAWAVREAEVQATSDAAWQIPREQLRRAIKQLKLVEEQLAGSSVRNQKVPLSQVRSLKQNVQYQLGNAYLNQAITYRSTNRDLSRVSPDCTSAATRALGYFQPLAARGVVNDLTWKSRVSEVRCLRVLGQYQQAQRKLQQWTAIPAESLGLASAESIRLALDVQQIDAALQLADQHGAIFDPEFHLACIEAHVAAAQHYDDQPQRADRLQKKAFQWAAELGEAFGTYWALRAEILVSRLVLEGERADADMLNRAAETMLRKASPESAKRIYLEAAEKSKLQEDPTARQRTLEFLYKAALVDHQQGELQLAIDQFRSISKTYAAIPLAADAHLLAVFDAAALFQRFAAKKSDQLASGLRQYDELLQEHLELWPQSATADQARLWAARLAMARRQWTTAIDLYRGVAMRSQWEIEAYQGLGQALKKWRESSADPDRQFLQTLRTWMEERMNQTQTSAATILAAETAELALLNPPDYELAKRVLTDRWQSLVDSAARQRLGSLDVLAAMGQGKPSQARDLFGQLVPMQPEYLLRLLRGFIPLRQSSPGNVPLRQFTLEILDLLKPHKALLSPADRHVIAQATADYAPADQALRIYQQLAEVHPQSLEIQQRFAELLSETNDASSHSQTLLQWRLVARLAKQQTPDWFAAKLAVAKTLFLMGERREARELVQYLMALYPDLGTSELKRQYEILLRQAGG